MGASNLMHPKLNFPDPTTTKLALFTVLFSETATSSRPDVQTETWGGGGGGSLTLPFPSSPIPIPLPFYIPDISRTFTLRVFPAMTVVQTTAVSYLHYGHSSKLGFLRLLVLPSSPLSILHPGKAFLKITVTDGVPGWLSCLSVPLLISAGVVVSVSWDQGPHQPPC